MSNPLTARVVIVLGLTVVATAGIDLAARDGRETPTSRVLVTGVPFVSWHDAALVHHTNEQILNPSWIASIWMLRGHATGTLQTPAEFETALKLAGTALPELTKLPGSSVDTIRHSIDEGVPVLLTTMPLTSAAHPLYVAFVIGITLGQFPKPRDGPRSGVLGPMISLDDLRQFTERSGTNPAAESVHLAARVVVGYDDERRVFLIHDPTFGPAWEVGYDDFERMWDVSTREGLVAIRPDAGATAVARGDAPRYRPRSANERAAERFIAGYALSATGRTGEGEQQFREGLALEGVSVGYRHLLLVELALTLRARGHLEEAVDAARMAADLVPQNAVAWETLAELYGSSTRQGASALRKDAEKRVKKLNDDPRSQQQLAAALPSDFWVIPLAPWRGWAHP